MNNHRITLLTKNQVADAMERLNAGYSLKLTAREQEYTIQLHPYTWDIPNAFKAN